RATKANRRSGGVPPSSASRLSAASSTASSSREGTAMTDAHFMGRGHTASARPCPPRGSAALLWFRREKMIVTRQELEAGLAALAVEVRDPRAGIYGTDSLSWQLNRELGNFLGAGRAALLQLAHPPVAHAIAEHSTTRADVRTRFRRTFANIFA